VRGRGEDTTPYRQPAREGRRLGEKTLVASPELPYSRGMVHVGIGYDVHPLVEGRKLILGGVDIAHGKGLDGHADADVLMHAICDAVLGALGEADIGHFFPNTDPRWRGAPSKMFLSEAARLVGLRDGQIRDWLDAGDRGRSDAQGLCPACGTRVVIFCARTPLLSMADYRRAAPGRLAGTVGRGPAPDQPPAPSSRRRRAREKVHPRALSGSEGGLTALFP